MLCHATILTLILALAVYANPLLYQVPEEECCARAHFCQGRLFGTPSCSNITRPQCPNDEHRRCVQNIIPLKTIYYQPSGLSAMCCTVLNCPTIYYSDCSYKPDECDAQDAICTPERYGLYVLEIRCPNNVIYKVAHYLPYCCSCSECPGDQFAFG